MKDLMEQVFGTLDERDSKALKKIIEAYGYFDEDEDETGEVEPESTKQLLNLLKEFKETRKDEFEIIIKKVKEADFEEKKELVDLWV